MKITKRVARLLIYMIDASEAARNMNSRDEAKVLMDCEEAVIEALKNFSVDGRMKWANHSFSSNEEIVSAATDTIKWAEKHSGK